MRISDWSSDVCSSDLDRGGHGQQARGDSGHDRHADVLTEVVEHAAAAAPVVAVGEPVDDLRQQAHEAPPRDRAHGVSARSISESTTSATTASTIDRRSDEHTSELPSLTRTQYADFCMQKTKVTPQ